MPSSATEKTKSARSSWHCPALILAGALSIFAIVVLAARSGEPFTTLRVHGRDYRLEIAATPTARFKGLGGRTALLANQGMLFSFDHAAVECFWMKDMRFALDMIWVRDDHRIGAIEANVSPATYPHSYCPNVTARFVIELRAGQAAAAGMYTGEALTF